MRVFAAEAFKEMITSSGLTPREIVFELAQQGISLTPAAVKAWEEGKNWCPNAVNFLSMVAQYGKGPAKKAAKELLKEFFKKE